MNDNADENIKKSALQKLFRSFMDCPDEIANAQISKIVERIRAGIETVCAVSEPLDLKELMLRINDDFPGDRGVFCPLLLNILKLSPGEGFFMGANNPHAYISGDCVECMALSDNVIRAALTPKYKDVETLCSSLTYDSGKAVGILSPLAIDQYTMLYRPPLSSCAEFEVERTSIPGGVEGYSPVHVNCGSILLFLEGIAALTLGDKTLNVQAGSIIYTSSGSDVKIDVKGADSVLFYRAHVNLGDS